MKTKLIVFATAAALLASTGPPLSARQTRNAAVDKAFEAFWGGASTSQAADVADAVVRSGVTFDEAYGRLRQGRTYTAQKTGQMWMSNRAADGVEDNFVSESISEPHGVNRPFDCTLYLALTNAPTFK